MKPTRNKPHYLLFWVTVKYCFVGVSLREVQTE